MDKMLERLQKIARQLHQEQVRALLEFAEFLHTRHAERINVGDPLEISRPLEESVVGAIKRLRASYPMLDPAQLLSETSDLMSAHITQGRDATEVIDDLEALFEKHYHRLIGRPETSRKD